MERSVSPIPTWQLYGEESPFPDVLHIERIIDRAEGLHWVIAPHRHLHLHQLFLILSGEVSLSVDGSVVSMTPPILLNMPRGTVHGFSFSAGTNGYVLTLPTDDFPELFGPMAEAALECMDPFLAVPPACLTGKFAELWHEHGRHGRLRRTVLRARAALLFCRVLALNDAQRAVSGHAQADPRVKAFQDLVGETLRLRLRASIDDYAARLGISSRQLRRLCENATGLSPQAYVAQQVLREACRLLAYTPLSVQGVGYALGFDDPAYFSRFFQRGTGHAPSAYRARFEQPLLSSMEG